MLRTVMLLALMSLSVNMSRERRSLSQLRQVVSVLEQQGRLHEVDSDLLARINDALDNDSDEGSEEVGSSERKHVSAVSECQGGLPGESKTETVEAVGE